MPFQEMLVQDAERLNAAPSERQKRTPAAVRGPSEASPHGSCSSPMSQPLITVEQVPSFEDSMHILRFSTCLYSPR
jgi:hypothetical protein